jgi:hypothetical protein
MNQEEIIIRTAIELFVRNHNQFNDVEAAAVYDVELAEVLARALMRDAPLKEPWQKEDR